MKNEINKLSFTSGLILCGIALLLMIIYRLIDPTLQFTSQLVGIINFCAIITIMTILTVRIRNINGGYWPFKTAFRSLAIISITVSIALTLYNFLLFKFIDPGLPENINNVMLNNITQTLSRLHISDEKMDRLSKPFKYGTFEGKFSPTFKNELSNLIIGLLFFLCISLIIAAFVKKKPIIKHNIN